MYIVYNTTAPCYIRVTRNETANFMTLPKRRKTKVENHQSAADAESIQIHTSGHTPHNVVLV